MCGVPFPVMHYATQAAENEAERNEREYHGSGQGADFGTIFEPGDAKPTSGDFSASDSPPETDGNRD